MSITDVADRVHSKRILSSVMKKICMILLILTFAGCSNDSSDTPNFPDFSGFPINENGELWIFCRQGNIYDAFCAGFGETCPEGWTAVSILDLPTTCCRDSTGNAFWADVDQCAPEWITVEDGCLTNQPICN